MRYRADLGFIVAFLIIWLSAACGPARAGDVLMQHNDNQRTGANLSEPGLKAAAVRDGSFGKLWTLYADGQVVAQPLYVARLAIDTRASPDTPPVNGTFNTVIVATMHNTIYAYDADHERPGPDGRTVPLWARWLGKPRPSGKDIDMFSTNDPEWGILGTPVISADRKTLYAVAWHDDGPQGYRYRLHVLDLASGAERKVATIGVSSTDPSQPCKRQSAFNPCTHKQRSALVLSNGVLYVGFGGDGSRGALYAFDAVTLAQKATWSPTPTGKDGGIWQSGQGPAVDGNGNLYLMIGNGTFDADKGGKNFGDSFVRLGWQGQDLVVRDYFTPCNQDFLRTTDLDLGSGGPVLVPGATPLVIGGGKEGVIYVLARDNLGKYLKSPKAPDCQNTNARQEVLAFPAARHGHEPPHYGNIHGSPVYWKGPDAERIYAWGENNRLKAFPLKNGKLDTGAVKQSKFQPPLGMPGGMVSLSADGSKAGSGVVWAVVPLNGDANRQRGVQGIVLAMDAEDVSRTLWTSELNAGRDRVGLFAKFVPPTVAGGKIFVATYGNSEPLRDWQNGRPGQFPTNYYITVYGNGAAAPPNVVIVNQGGGDVAVLRATVGQLSLDAGTCAPVNADSIDCTDALKQKLGRPSLERAVLPRGMEGCALLRTTVASKDAGLSNATGIGFWTTQALAGDQTAGDMGRFVSSADLVSVGRGTLKGGSAATLFEFVAVVNCQAGDAGARETLFKPYMQFENAGDGRIYRNWDVAQDYRITDQVTNFDRTGEVLQ
jgi:outer membrane protein assembly factor BamB